MMVKVLLYAYATGTYSSRKIARRLIEDVAMRFLAAGNTPDFWTLSDFRQLAGNDRPGGSGRPQDRGSDEHDARS